MARLSNYVIDTEITDENQNMLVHGYTGAIDIIDRELANYLKNNKDTLERGTFPFGEENYDASEQAWLYHRQNSSGGSPICQRPGKSAPQEEPQWNQVLRIYHHI